MSSAIRAFSARRRARVGLRRLWLLALLCLLPVAGGCGDDESKNSNPEVPQACNPLAPNWDCLLPYPTDYFMVEDDSLPSGYRVVLPEQHLPVSEDDVVINPLANQPADGFSIVPQILVKIPYDIDDSNLVFNTDDVLDSMGDDSPTVLLEADTGIRVMHFAELDPRTDDPEDRGFFIRPLERLEYGTRYIVAIRRLQLADGGDVPAGSGFARLRDGTAGGHPVLGALADHYEQDIFPALDQAGVDRSELQLAWDFTTATEENMTGAMVHGRELAMEALEANPPVVTVTDEYFDPWEDGEFYSRVRGTIEVPLIVEDGRPGAMLARDADGDVMLNGTSEVEFTILIPQSAVDASPFEPARIIQFGHGFFGSAQGEMEGGFVRSFSSRLGAVMIGIDWWGMCTKDYPDVISDIFDDPSHAVDFTDRVHQAMINLIAVSYAIKTTLAEQPELQLGGDPIYDPDHVYYYGISQGGILGGTYAALGPHVERATLDVGACAFPFMMMRSKNFLEFLQIINMVVPGELDKQKFIALIQTVFERIDPVNYARHVTHDLYPGSPAERLVLMHTGIGDAQVPNLASHIHARALGVVELGPAPRTIPLIDVVDGPLDVSAVQEYDFGLGSPLPGTYADPPEDGNEVHEGVRRLDAAQDQIDEFFHPDGQIVNFCDGVCDPE